MTAIIAVHARLLISIQNSIAKTLKLRERGLKLQEMKVNQVRKFTQKNLLALYGALYLTPLRETQAIQISIKLNL